MTRPAPRELQVFHHPERRHVQSATLEPRSTLSNLPEQFIEQASTRRVKMAGS